MTKEILWVCKICKTGNKQSVDVCKKCGNIARFITPN